MSGTVAIPSKGRLKDDCLALLERAGLSVALPAERAYETTIPALPGVRVLMLPATEIAERLLRGEFDAGITGEDVLHERAGSLASQSRWSGAGAGVFSILGEPGTVAACRLGFGGARLVTAVPESWLDCETMDDLREIADEIRARQQRPLRVATKYVRLARAFFAQHLIADYRIALSTGATEAAPASGLADVIVDITTSGATLRDNALKIPADGELFASEAVLALSRPSSGALAPGIAALTRAVGKALGQETRAEQALAVMAALPR